MAKQQKTAKKPQKLGKSPTASGKPEKYDHVAPAPEPVSS
jgi:hypothetical protein